MKRLLLGSGTSVSIGGHQFRYMGQNADGVWLGRTDDTEALEVIPPERLLALIADEKAEIHRPARSNLSKCFSSTDPASLMALLPEEQFRKTCHRWAIVLSVLALSSQGKLTFSDKDLAAKEEDIIDGAEEILRRKTKYRACDEKLSIAFPCTRQIRRWCKRWRGSGGSILSLVNRRCISKAIPMRWSLDQKRFLNRACEIFLEPECQHKALALKLVRSEFNTENKAREAQGEAPIGHISNRAFMAAINQLDTYLLDLAKDGRDYALSRSSAAVPTQEPLFIGARIEIDAVRMDVMTLLTELGVATHMTPEQLDAVPRIRVTVTMAVDVATRCILGFFVSENEDTASALRTLHLVTLDKTSWSEAAGCKHHWLQAVALHDVFSDAGSAFANERILWAVAAAGGNFTVLPAGVARLRGTCERVFRTINNGLLTLLSGRTFGDIIKRGQYDSEARAVHTIDDLTNLLIRYIVDVYNQIPRGALGGLSPAQMWDHLQNESGVSPCPSPRVRRLAFGYREERTVTEEGVKIAAIPFNSPELMQAVPKRGGRKWTVFVDPFDLGAVTVDVNGQLIEAFPPDPKFRGVTLDEWNDGHAYIWPSAHSDKEQSFETALEAIDAIRNHDQAARRRRGLTFVGITADRLQEVEDRRFHGLSLAKAHRSVSDIPPPINGELPGNSVSPTNSSTPSESDRVHPSSENGSNTSSNSDDTSWWDGQDDD